MKEFIIEIDGIEYPAQTSCGAMLLFKKTTDKEVNEISGLSDSIIWLWCCVKSASSLTDNPLPYDCQEFADRLSVDVMNRWAKKTMEEIDPSKKKTPKGAQKGSMKS